MSREIELKLEYVGKNWSAVHSTLTSIATLGPCMLDRVRTETITDTYSDTADLLLQSRNAALRVRKKSSDRQVCLKHGDNPEGGMFSRVEIEAPDSPAGWRTITTHLAQLGVDLKLESSGPPLQPVIEVSSVRSRRFVLLADKPIAELTLDRVTYHGIDRSYHDIELELTAGASRHHLDELLAALTAMFPGQLRPAPCSKFARGLTLLGVTTGIR